MTLVPYPNYSESGVEWLGQIPAHWSALSLARVTFDKCDGPFGSGLKSEHYVERGVRVVRLQNIREGRFDATDAAFIDEEYYRTELGGHDVLEGDLLIAGLGDERNTVGRACVAPPEIEPAMVKADCFRFQLDTRRVLTGFAAAQLTAGARYDAGLLSSGSTRSRISLTEMAGRRLALPPKREQVAIVTFLDRETAKIDALVWEQQRLIGLLKEKRQAVISYAITKGLVPNAPTKDSGIDWPASVPAHWEVLPLTRVVNQFVDYRGKTPTKIDDGVPLVTATQIKEGRVDHTLDPVFISEEEYAERMTRGFPEKGDVLITTEAPLGETAQIEEERVALGQRIILMKPNKSKVTGDYLFTHFRSQFGQNELWKRASGSTASGIRADRLRASAVLVPPRDEQIAIVNWITEKISRFPPIEIAIHRQIELLQERRAALISAAVTGKIDVRGLVTNTPVRTDSRNVRLVVAAEIIERLSQKANFGRVKLQKLTYLTEAHAGVSELDGNYLRAAAGPLDRDMIAEMEAQLQRVGHVSVDQAGGQGKQVIYKFHGSAGAYREELATILADRKARFLHLLSDLGDLETKSVEAIATLYAVWDDALIDGQTPTDDAVVSGVLEEWHPDKAKKFRAAELHEWLGWMRRHNLVPEGNGPRTSTGRFLL
jgi:type I restriction enzyme, S subunit